MAIQTSPSLPSKLLIAAPSFRAWDLGTHLQQLLRQRGVHCDRFAYENYPDENAASQALSATVRACRPQALLGLKLKKILPAALREIRRKNPKLVTALWSVDCLGESLPRWEEELAREVDLSFTTARGLVGEFAKQSRRGAHWLYEGVFLPAYPSIRASADRRRLYGSKLAFVGTLFNTALPSHRRSERVRFLKRLHRRFGLRIWGTQGTPAARSWWGRDCPLVEWPAYHEELVKICLASDVMIGFNTVHEVDRYFSNRTFLTLAAGGFHLTHYVPGLEEMFENHRHLVWFRSAEECEDLCAYYLARERSRRRIAAQGKQWVRRRYGMARQVNRLLKILGQHV